VAEDVRSSEAVAVDAPVTPRSAGSVSRSDRARRGAYRFRFAAIYFGLAAVLGAGVGSFVVLAAREDPPPPPAWSAWEPDGSSLARVRQIADRVPRSYTEGGRQLVFADSSRPQLSLPGQDGSAPTTVNVSRIAVLADTSRGQAEEGEFDTFDAGSAITFRMCGSGENCSVAGGTPSEDRLLLLRRQALELSLYTFRYVEGVDSVVVYLPPAPPDANGRQQQSGALFLRRPMVKGELGVPLARTLAPKPPVIGRMSEFESSNVDRLTRPNIYAYGHQPVADGSLYLTLTPAAAA
jgi:hypothetical protein